MARSIDVTPCIRPLFNPTNTVRLPLTSTYNTKLPIMVNWRLTHAVLLRVQGLKGVENVYTQHHPLLILEYNVAWCAGSEGGRECVHPAPAPAYTRVQWCLVCRVWRGWKMCTPSTNPSSSRSWRIWPRVDSRTTRSAFGYGRVLFESVVWKFKMRKPGGGGGFHRELPNFFLLSPCT